MSIIQYYYHQGKIDDLASRYHQFSKLKNASVTADQLKWQVESTGMLSHHVQVAFFGKSGYGKSSTINSFFGDSILKTSDIEACTRRCESLDFELSKNCYLSLADFPGIGESEYRDKEYLQMYSDFLSLSPVVVYVLRADQRDFSVDLLAYKTVFPGWSDKEKIIFSLNCCDKIEPVNRSRSVEPNVEQRRNIDMKVNLIRKLFDTENPIVPYSASTGWNMSELAHEIVEKIVNSQLVALRQPPYF